MVRFMRSSTIYAPYSCATRALQQFHRGFSCSETSSPERSRSSSSWRLLVLPSASGIFALTTVRHAARMRRRKRFIDHHMSFSKHPARVPGRKRAKDARSRRVKDTIQLLTKCNGRELRSSLYRLLLLFLHLLSYGNAWRLHMSAPPAGGPTSTSSPPPDAPSSW